MKNQKSRLNKIDKSELDWALCNELSKEEIIDIIFELDDSRREVIISNLLEG